MTRLAAAVAALVLVPAALPAAAGYGKPERAGLIVSQALPEVSGMTAATVVSGGWWVLNDSGNTPELHLITGKGRLVTSVSLNGATNVDWEDLASGPGVKDRRTLYVGDIGDNNRVRDDLVVYRVGEPARNARSATAAKLPFRYPDGHHDAEALFADPASGRLYIVTKSLSPQEPCGLYRFPLPQRPGVRVTLDLVGGRFAKLIALVPLVTGATVSPDGTRLAVRTYLQAWEWRRPRGSSFESIFAATPHEVSLHAETQGESIAYTSDGKALETTSENPPAPIWRMDG